VINAFASCWNYKLDLRFEQDTQLAFKKIKNYIFRSCRRRFIARINVRRNYWWTRVFI